MGLMKLNLTAYKFVFVVDCLDKWFNIIVGFLSKYLKFTRLVVF